MPQRFLLIKQYFKNRTKPVKRISLEKMVAREVSLSSASLKNSYSVAQRRANEILF
jgi:hypothetical protein